MTLKDIASNLGIDASTVSRALDPEKSHLVREDTALRVREAAKRLGYRGDRVAGALRRGVTGTIGVIVADLANPFIAPVIHGIAQSLAKEQMLPMVVETQVIVEFCARIAGPVPVWPPPGERQARVRMAWS